MRRVVWLVVVCVGLLLVLPAAAQNDRPTVQLNGGMTAQLVSVIHDRAGISATVKITNTGSQHVFLIFTGTPSALDDTGGAFIGSVGGVGWCRNESQRCIGFPSTYYAFPPQQYTEIDPGTSVTALFKLQGRTNGSRSLSFSAEMAFRSVNDLAKDADLSDRQKLQQVTMGSLGFGPVAITDAPVNPSPVFPPARQEPATIPASSYPSNQRYPAPAPFPPPVRQRVPTVPYSPPARNPLAPRPSAAADTVGQGITSVVNDRNAGKIITGQRVVWAFLLLIFGILLWTDGNAFRKTGELTCFGRSAAWVVLVGGVWSWVGYFGDHGAFFAWPLVVGFLFLLLLALAWWGEDRRKKKRAEELMTIPDVVDHSGPADLDDFDDWKRPAQSAKPGKPANVIDFKNLKKKKE